MSTKATLSDFKAIFHDLKVQIEANFSDSELHQALFDFFLLLFVELVKLSYSLSGISSKFLIASGQDHLVEVRVAQKSILVVAVKMDEIKDILGVYLLFESVLTLF